NPYDPACTSQSPRADEPDALNAAFERLVGQCNNGHHNWAWVTYDAPAAQWGDFSTSDSDYNLRLFRSDQALYTANHPQFLQAEFDSDETIDQFSDPPTGWWREFHDAVDKEGTPKFFGGDPQAASRFFGTREVVVLGLLGTDDEHNSWSELHPVIAMAVHLKD